jgi:hypothetical protein
MNGVILALALKALLFGLFYSLDSERFAVEFDPEGFRFDDIGHPPARTAEIGVVNRTADFHARLLRSAGFNPYRKRIIMLETEPRPDIERSPARRESNPTVCCFEAVTAKRQHLHHAFYFLSRSLAAIPNEHVDAEERAFLAVADGNLYAFNREIGAELTAGGIRKSLVSLARGLKRQGNVNDAKNRNNDGRDGGPEQPLRPQGHLLLGAKVLFSALLFAGGVLYGVRSLCYAARGERIAENVIGGIGMLVGALMCAGALALMVY